MLHILSIRRGSRFCWFLRWQDRCPNANSNSWSSIRKTLSSRNHMRKGINPYSLKQPQKCPLSTKVLTQSGISTSLIILKHKARSPRTPRHRSLIKIKPPGPKFNSLLTNNCLHNLIKKSSLRNKTISLESNKKKLISSKGNLKWASPSPFQTKSRKSKQTRFWAFYTRTNCSSAKIWSPAKMNFAIVYYRTTTKWTIIQRSKIKSWGHKLW